MISAFPTYLKNGFNEGKIIKASSYCKKGEHPKCKEYCGRPFTLTNLGQCPFGLTTYKYNDTTIICGLRVKGYYKKRNEDATQLYRPIFSKIQFEQIISDINSHSNVVTKQNEQIFTNSVFHEIRKLNKAIKAASEKIIKFSKEGDNSYFLEKSKNIFASSSLISTRLNAYDFETNPEKIAGENRRLVGIYKKFEKAVHILTEIGRNKKVAMRISGTSREQISALPVFDLLPFILLENAIKYSTEGDDVTIEFTESGDYVCVTIKNIGPRIGANEKISDLTLKGGRGKYAQEMDLTGTGYGLYLAKMICGLHDIDLRISSAETKYSKNNIEYSEFTVILECNN